MIAIRPARGNETRYQPIGQQDVIGQVVKFLLEEDYTLQKRDVLGYTDDLDDVYLRLQHENMASFEEGRRFNERQIQKEILRYWQ